jgi:succinoglycan biosynthesis protein ExoW
VSVIIPFFQRRPGLLARALESVCAQRLDASIEMLVVDDESPLDPAGEVPAQLPPHVAVRIVRQKNGGPGAARNSGLDHAAADTRYVAFLDSDDEWLPDHLRNAIDALGDDLDFYFCNHFEPGSSVDEFSHRGIVALEKHRPLARGSRCFEFVGNMRDQIIGANVIETSTVVYRRSALQAVRFRPEFRNAFEDHLFWLDAVKAARGIAFSADVGVQYGEGVSIWRSAGLGSEYQFPRIIDQLRFIATLTSAAATTGAQAKLLSDIKARVRNACIAEILHRLKRRMPLDWQALAKIIRLDPALLVWGMPIAARIALGRGAAR